MNKSFQDLTGWVNSLVGQSVQNVVSGWRSDALAVDPVRAMIKRADTPPLAVELQLSTWRSAGEIFIGAIVLGASKTDELEQRLKEQELRAAAVIEEASVAHKRLEHVIEMLPQAVCVFDAQDRYFMWNRRYVELYPEIADKLQVGMSYFEILRLSADSGYLPEKVDNHELWLSNRMAKHALPNSREEFEWTDGRWILHDDRRLADGGAIGMRIDITDIKRREASFRLLFQSNPVPMLVFEQGTLRIADANDAACSLYGAPREEFLSMTMPELHQKSEQEDASRVYETLVDAYEGRTIWHHRTAPGDVVDVLIFIRASKHQDRPCFLAAVVDVSDRIRAEAKIAHIAHHDPVTGLANRVRFRAFAEAALAAGPARRAGKLAIHYLDLDGFKLVNDTYGHSAGDTLLRMVGERLRATVRGGDLVARLGGDEFAVVQTSGLVHAKAVAARLLECLEASFLIEGDEVRIGASLGLAVAPREGIDLDTLVDAADLALYQAKAAGRNSWRAAGEVQQMRQPAVPDNDMPVQRKPRSKTAAK